MSRGFVPLGFGAFMLFGAVLVLPGANQDAIAAALDLDLGRSGLVASVLSLGIGAGVLLAGPMVDRYPRRPLFLASTLVTALALLTVDSGMSYSRTLVHVAFMGLGGGAFDTLLNAVTVEGYEDRAARTLSLLHGGATLGAVLTPPLVGALADVASGTDWAASFRATGVLFLLLSVWVAVLPLPPPRRGVQRAGERRLGAIVPALAPLAIAGFAYVGIEAALTLFAVPYASEALDLPAGRGRAAISAFWLGLLLGRIGLWRYTGRPGPGLLFAMGASAALVLAAGATFRFPFVSLWCAAVGLCLGGVFPLMVALAGQRVPQAVGLASSLVVGLGSAGGFVIPWLTGALGDALGIALAITSLAAWALVIAASGLFRGSSAAG